MVENQIHPQTASFLLLFPKPESDVSNDCVISKQIDSLWKEHFKDLPLTFVGMKAKSIDYDHYRAEMSGDDYACKLYAYFKTHDPGSDAFEILLGNLPYPDNRGEFVLRGNRYYLPMVLCSEYKYNKFKYFLNKENPPTSNDSSEKIEESQNTNDRDTDNLRVLLIDELITHRITQRLYWLTKILKNRSWSGDIPQLRTISRSLLNSGNLTVIHKFIYRYGKLVDRENPLSQISQQSEMSFYYPGIVHSETTGEFRLRDVDDKDLYRLCPVQTPQGHKVGLITYLARRGSVDFSTRKLTAPSSPTPGDSLSDGASLIPFIEHDDVSRALMGTNMMKQALPLEKPDMPLTQTGWESVLGQREEVSESFKTNGILTIGKNLLTAYLPWGLDTFEDGMVVSESAASALTSAQEKIFWFSQQSNGWPDGGYKSMRVTAENPRISEREKACLDEKGIVKPGTIVKPGDLLVSAYMTKQNDIHKTKFIDVFSTGNATNLKFDKEPSEFRDASFRLPHNFKGEVTQIIDSAEMPEMKLPSGTCRRIGIAVKRREKAKVGDKITSRHGAKGVIVRVLADRNMPYLKTEEPWCTDTSCPLTQPHRHIQVLLNPIGVIGRLNVGQLYETMLSKVSENDQKPIIVKPFGNPWDLSQIKNALVSNGFSEDGKEQLYIYENNAEIRLRYRSLVGPQYFLRLNHLPEDKIQGRSSGRPYDYTLRDNQPRQGKQIRDGQIIGSGQRIGEMETWSLAGHSAWRILDDLLTVKSDDAKFRKNGIYDLADFDSCRSPQSLKNLILVFRSLGLDLRLLDRSGKNVTQNFLENKTGVQFSEVAFSYAKPDQMNEWLLGGEITSVSLYESLKKKSEKRIDSPHLMGLLSREIFDPLKPWQMGVIKLACPILHPFTKYLGSKIDPTGYMLASIPVLPVRFRNERLGFVRDFENDLNLLYRNVLQKNSRLKTVLDDEDSNDELKELLKASLSTAVQLLFSGGKILGKQCRGIADILKGKEGLVRGHMSGKRVDYSGRSVIIGDPSLSLDEASLPAYLWDKLLAEGPKAEKPLVLLNRQPSLHRHSIQALKARRHEESNVIRINPFVCKPFNADFDGDTIAVHVPRTKMAKAEAEKLIPSRNLLSQANGQLVLGFDKDLALAAAYITYGHNLESDEELPFTSEADMSLAGKGFWDELTVQGIKTTAGRLHIKRLFGNVPVLNRCIDKRQWFENLEKLAKIAAKDDPHIFVNFTANISSLFQETLKRSGLSLSLTDFYCYLPNDNSAPSLLWFLRKTGKYDQDLEKQIVIKRGQMRRPGRDDELTDPIDSCLMMGHSEIEYLSSSHGARAGLVDKGLITSYSGHLLRDLIYRLQHLYIVEVDCCSTDGLIAENFPANQITATRFGIDGKLLTNITEDTRIRSPLTCTAKTSGNRRGICQKCYGLDPATGKLPDIGLPVGILSAQSMGERVSQETLKSFHSGGIKSSEIKGLALVRFLRAVLSKKTKVPEAEKLLNILETFPQSARPNLVHFEVILRAYQSDNNTNNFLNKLAHSQSPRRFFNAAAKGAKDDLYDVISRILSGQLITTAFQGEANV
jgi:DNA-directed RNA polymerase beta' subunit